MAAVEAMWVGYLALPPETMGDTLILANNLTIRLYFQPQGKARDTWTVNYIPLFNLNGGLNIVC